MRRALALLLPLALATAQAQTGALADAYSALRPAVCLLMGKQPDACPLPSDIVAPVSYENDLAPALARAGEVHVIGRLALLKDNVLRSLFARGLTPPGPDNPPFTLYYASLREDTALLREAYRAGRFGRSFALNTLALPEVDAVRTVTRVPFVLVGAKVYTVLQDGSGRAQWLVFTGRVAATVAAAVRGGAPYLAEAAEREKAVEEEERR